MASDSWLKASEIFSETNVFMIVIDDQVISNNNNNNKYF